jgi:hypothetical protein
MPIALLPPVGRRLRPNHQAPVRASRVLLVGIVAVCVLAIGAAYSASDAGHARAPAAEVGSSPDVVIVQPGPVPLIPPPDVQPTGPTPSPPPSATASADTAAGQGKAGALP